MKRIVLDGSIIQNEEDVTELFVDALSLSEYAGQNLHTLYDALVEFTEPLEIRLTGEDVFLARQPELAEELIEILEEAMVESDMISFEMTDDDGDGYDE